MLMMFLIVLVQFNVHLNVQMQCI